jgi:hypothetical protein
MDDGNASQSVTRKAIPSSSSVDQVLTDRMVYSV